MNFQNCIRILKKDWKTTIKNKQILLTMTLLPILFTFGLPIAFIMGALMEPYGFNK